MNKIFLITLFIIFISCNTEIKQPERPKNVPKTAIWEGGTDGGTWIQCDSTNTDNIFYCKIFNDFDGTLLSEGKYKLDGISQPVDSIRKYLGVFTGSKIILRNKKFLILIK